MNSYFDKTYLAIDFETSDYASNSACSVGLVKFYQDTIIDTYYALIKPPKPKIYFTHIHGLTWSMLSKEQTFIEQWDSILDFCEGTDAFVAHNASFDRRILQGTCLYYGLEVPMSPFYCTLKASRKYFKLKSNNLQNVCNSLNIGLVHHNALSDATAAAKIFMHCLENKFDISMCCA